MNSGIIVSRDGYSVESATILQQVFNSGLNTLKIYSTGTATSNANGSRTVTVTHNLGYAPVYLVFFTATGLNKWYSDHTAEPDSGSLCSVTALSDSSNLSLYMYSSSLKNIIVKYFIMIDPGET